MGAETLEPGMAKGNISLLELFLFLWVEG